MIVRRVAMGLMCGIAVWGCGGGDEAARTCGLGPCDPTRLDRAIDDGDVDEVRASLEQGADPNVGTFGSPLFSAARDGDLAIVQLLLDHGADAAEVDGGGMTPLLSAAFGNSVDVVAPLVEHGADPCALISWEFAGETYDGMLASQLTRAYGNDEVAAALAEAERQAGCDAGPWSRQ